MKTTKLTVYYAHPMALYGTPVERDDLRLLKRLGFKVLNPAKRKLATMEAYIKLACSCDVVAFRAFQDGKIGSGVHAEVVAAVTAGIPIIEMPTFQSGRVLSRNETRERMGLPMLLYPKTAPLRTVREVLYPDDLSPDEFGDQDWGGQ